MSLAGSWQLNTKYHLSIYLSLICHIVRTIAKIRIRSIDLDNNILSMLFPDFDNCAMVM